MELIDKDTVVAEIERRKKELIELSNDFENQWACASLDNILSFINTLEVKEVNLEEEKLPISNSLTEEGLLTFEDGSQAIITRIN